MMDITKRNRTELKSYFVKNAIPTESNFVDLIDGALNQKDDGIVKLSGDPLSIEAAGDATSLKKAINFYRSFSDANPDWTINLNPRSNPNDASTGKSGFNISDGEGNSRLFIDRGTGNVGVGTSSPQATLHLSGLMKIDGNNSLEFGAGVSGKEGNAGKIGYQTFTADALDIVGAGATSAGRKIKLWAEGGATVEGSLSLTGNVGIGTTTPEAKLEVVGGAIRPAAGNAETAGIMFPKDPGGGGGDAAWIRYYARAGEQTTFEIGTSNDVNDHIAFMASGNVGIGITNPGEKLHVNRGKIQLDGNQQIKFTDTDTSNNLKVQLWSGYGLGINASTLFYAANGRHSWRDSNGATERMALTTGADGGLSVTGTGNSSFLGNVGIGTTGPNAKLQVDTPHAAASQALILSNSNTAFAADEGVYQSYYVGATAGNEMARLLAANKTAGTGSYGYLAFYTRDADRVTEKVRIDNTGNVGIGTIAAVAKLDVAHGTRSGTHPSAINGLYVTGNFSPEANGVEFRHSNGTQGIGFGYNTIYATGSNPNQHLNLMPRGTGNVGIGTTTPEYQLTVSAASTHLQLRRESTETTGDKQVFLELVQVDPSPAKVPEVYPSIRFHHHNRFWQRIEARSDGFHLKVGNLSSDDYVDVRAANVRLTDNLSVPGGVETLSMLRGVINSNGAALAGSGFTVRRVGTGLYDITFTQAFASIPGASATQIYGVTYNGTATSTSNGGDTRDNAVITTLSANMMRVKTGGGGGDAADRVFTFLAIGPR